MRITEEIEDAIRQAAERAAPVFKAQGWTWATTAGVPGRLDIERTLRRLVGYVNDEDDTAATGRLEVHLYDGILDFNLHLDSVVILP